MRTTVLLMVFVVLGVFAHFSDAASITWYGQSFFVVTSSTGVRIAFDPYHTNSSLNYTPPKTSADLVFISHDHFDHNNPDLLQGKHTVIKPIGEGVRTGTLSVSVGSGKSERVVKVPFVSVHTWHDDVQGRKRGGNTVHKVVVDGVSIVHLGDIGELLDAEQIKAIGRVDILLVPVGGYFTIDAGAADKVVKQLKPKVVIPMHYATEKTSLPISDIRPFILNKNNVVQNGHTYTFTKNNLPKDARIVVMKYE